METVAYKLSRMMPPRDDLLAKMERVNLDLTEGDVVVVASKVVSIWQGRSVEVKDGVSKDDLAKQEADKYLEREHVPGNLILHTMKENMLVSSAGIDRSNGNGYYILWPTEPDRAAHEILRWLKERYKKRRVGVIIADSKSMPLRRGAMGFALGFAGISPLKDYRGMRDIFGDELERTVSNVADAVAAAAVLVMGEGSEQTPVARVRGLDGLFDEETEEAFRVPIDEDVFSPFIKNVPWRYGHGQSKKTG